MNLEFAARPAFDTNAQKFRRKTAENFIQNKFYPKHMGGFAGAIILGGQRNRNPLFTMIGEFGRGEGAGTSNSPALHLTRREP